MRISRLTLPSLCIAGLTFFSHSVAHAAYIINILQVGPNVVATGNGSLDLTNLTFASSAAPNASVSPGSGQLYLGPPSSFSSSLYSGFTGPSNFGSGFGAPVSSGSGPTVGVNKSFGWILVPSPYTSGSLLATTTDTWSGFTFASLGLTPGTYVYSWGTSSHADTLTINVGATTPEPATLTLLTLAPLTLLCRRQRA